MAGNSAFVAQGVPRQALRLIGLSLIASGLAAACGPVVIEVDDGGEAGETGATNSTPAQPGARDPGHGLLSGGSPPSIEGGGGEPVTPIHDPGTPGHGGAGPDDGGHAGASSAGPTDYSCNPYDVVASPTTAVTLAGERKFGFPFDFEVQHLLSDAEGNVYAAGKLALHLTTVDLGGGPLAGPGQLFLEKLSPTGQHIWSRRLGSTTKDEERLVSLSFTSSGDVLVGAQVIWEGTSEHQFAAMRFDAAGELVDNVALDVPASTWLTGAWSAGTDVYFVAALSEDLTIGDITLPGEDAPERLQPQYVLHLDAEGELLDAPLEIAAQTVHDLVADADGNSYFLTSTGAGNKHVLALGPSLATRWQLEITETEAYDLALGAGQLVVAGLEHQPGLDKDQIFLERLASEFGTPLAKDIVPLGSTASAGFEVAVMDDASVIVGGRGRDGWTIAGKRLTSANGAGPFLMQVSPAGEPIWATMFCSYYDIQGGLLQKVVQNNGTLRAVILHEEELEVGLSQPIGRVGTRSASQELLTFELNQEPEGEP